MIENGTEREILRIMDSRGDMVRTYNNAADVLSGMGAINEAARARHIARELQGLVMSGIEP